MPSAFEADDRNLADWKLLLSGIAFALVATVLVAAGIARSQGAFADTVRVTAMMAEVGDGLPVKSDVKYRGVLVGIVTEIETGGADTQNRVELELWPHQVKGIPSTVTARVVPSNVFAVPSVQLVDNGPAPALRAGAEIHQDRSLATVQLQTSLTALSRIAQSVGRSSTDPTVGILAAVARATSGRGEEMLQAGAQLERVVRALDEVTTPDGGVSTLDALVRALEGLRSSAPDLLHAVNQSIIPLQTVARQQGAITALLSSGLVTTTSIGTALTNHTGTLTDITADMAPVLDVLARGSQNFPQISASTAQLAGRFQAEFWHPEIQNGVAKAIVELSPHKQYTRADCPRYGELAGPSCVTGPAGEAPVISGNVGPASFETGAVGGPADRDRIAAELGTEPDQLTTLVLGPVLRGNEAAPTSTEEPPR